MIIKVLYEELCPSEFKERLEQCPVAYLPLGTLEWHGPHLPLGTDGIESKGLFMELAQKIGGIVLPPLFLGPDRLYHDPVQEFYGMDIYKGDTIMEYTMRQLTGSAYWIPDQLYHDLLLAIAFQLHRAGFKILVAHGHGPSTNQFLAAGNEIEEKFHLKCISAWDFCQEKRLKFQYDHAAANETSITMELRPELVQLDRIISGEEKPIGIAGADPRVYASSEYGREIIDYTVKCMSEEILNLLHQKDI